MYGNRWKIEQIKRTKSKSVTNKYKATTDEGTVEEQKVGGVAAFWGEKKFIFTVINW